jgi:UDP-glucose 4-epimerase
MKSVAITGGNGFVGSALYDELRKRGYQARKLERMMDGEDVPEWRLEPHDVIIHAAARVHVMKENAPDPLEAFRRANVEGSLRLARQAAEIGVKRFVYVSSIKVNGESTSHQPFTSFDKPEPHDPYGLSKKEAEDALLHLSRNSQLEVVILRPPLIYGPNVKGNFERLMKAARRNIPLPLAGVKNKRSLIYLGNFIDALIVCTEHPNAKGQIFTVSDGMDISTPDLLRELARAENVRSALFPCPEFLLKWAARLAAKSDQLSRLTDSLQVDSKRIYEELDWSPPFSMRDGLHETVKKTGFKED